MRDHQILSPPAWTEPFADWYRHWAVSVVLGLVTMGFFIYLLSDYGLVTVLIVLALVPGTILNAWIGYQGRRLATAEESVLEARVVDGRIELGGMVSPMARRRWTPIAGGRLELTKAGSTRQGAALWSLSDGDADVRFLHDSDLTPERFHRLRDFAQSQGVQLMVIGD